MLSWGYKNLVGDIFWLPSAISKKDSRTAERETVDLRA
jgi:hypothetical protein